MKFGLNYDQNRLPKWSSQYVDYNGLRILLRAKTQRGESIEDLIHQFIEEISRVKSGVTDLYENLNARAEVLTEHYGNGMLAAEGWSGPPSIDVVSIADKRACVSLNTTYLELQQFEKINIMAVLRLMRKFEDSGGASLSILQRARAELKAWNEAKQRTHHRLSEFYRVFEGILSSNCDKDNHSNGRDTELSDSETNDAQLAESQALSSQRLSFQKHLRLCLDNFEGRNKQQVLGELLLSSVEDVQVDHVSTVLKSDPDIHVKTSLGETALYLAVQSGSLPAVQLITQYYFQHGETLDSAVPTTGWTPLMVACIKGHTDVAAYLLKSGVDTQIVDVLGWTAREHAAYRGHLTTASLEGFESGSKPDGELTGYATVGKAIARGPLPAGKKAVIITLGSVQGGHNRKALKRRTYSAADGTGLEAMFLEITIHGANCSSKIVELPILEEQSVDPLVGQIDLNAEVLVTVQMWKHQGLFASEKTLDSRGTVVLDQDYARFGASRESMLRETNVILLDSKNLEMTGSVLLSYVVATPFEGLDSHDAADYKRLPGESARLIGHRGLGQNTAGKSNLQIGENTVTVGTVHYFEDADANNDKSFLSAHKLGAPFVEFDVQLTRDLEPVIYHDFSLSASGSDIPIHDISLTQYKYAGDIQSPRDAMALAAGLRRPRASSSGEDSVLKALQAQERLRYTVDYDGKGFKANIRGHSIQEAHATLEELLETLPEDIGFNIEMKYQRLHEAIAAGVASVTIDINTFVDRALEKIKRLAGRRQIILSSFTPEICILLKLKQSAYPVMFITNAGKVPMVDKELRAASLQMAMKFARYWQLSGLVLACDTFLLCPRLISLVKSTGLVCASYGLGNNDPENAKMQADAGIDILIVDKVRLIAETLNTHQPTKNVI